MRGACWEGGACTSYHRGWGTLPSRSEAFALVIIEALAAGTPVAGYGPTLVEIRDRLGIVRSVEELFAANDLRSIEGALRASGRIRLFRSHKAGVADGEQKRDFVAVEDVVDALHFALAKPLPRGIYNLGTGGARSFLDLASATFAALGRAPEIEFIDTPAALRARYQGYVRDIAEKWLDWKVLGPKVERYQKLIAADVKADTRKLYSFEAFQNDVAIGEHSLKAFVEKRRAFLLK